jgi:hypothetical protein
MKVYAKSLLVGLCAAAVVLGVCWSAGLIPYVVYKAPPPLHPTPVAPSGDSIMVITTEVVDTTVIKPPWYVSALAGLALVTASGWQLRRLSLRDRRWEQN